MSKNNYNVSLNDNIEIKYLNAYANEENNFFYWTTAREFVETAQEKNFKILKITYFTYIRISQPNSHRAIEPSKRFGERAFSPEEFLLVSPKLVEEEQRNKAMEEIDKYMQEHFDANVT